MRSDCYRIDDKHLHLPKGLRLKHRGVLKWMGRQRRLEMIYEDVDGVWRGFMTVKVEKPQLKGGGKPLYIDLDVINLATVWFRGLKTAPSLFRQTHSIGLVVLDEKNSERRE